MRKLFISCFFFVLLIVLSMPVHSSNISSNNTFTDPDIFSYIGINNKVQLINQFCNFKCVISPLFNFSIVQIRFYNKDNSFVQYPMQYVTEGYYSYSIIYEEIGKYAFQIVVPINDDIIIESSVRSFWITHSFRDKDSDGITDSWEIKYGLNPDDPIDSKYDNDNDGYTNKEEFKMNTHPLRNHLFENAWIEINENSLYFLLSFLFFILLSWISLFGIRKVHS